MKKDVRVCLCFGEDERKVWSKQKYEMVKIPVVCLLCHVVQKLSPSTHLVDLIGAAADA